MDQQQLNKIIEGILLAADRPLTTDNIIGLFAENEQPERDQVNAVLSELAQSCEDRGYELKQVGSGYRYQVREELAPWISRLWEERPPRYSRALLETLALVAYRQPITRAEIEEVRGVAVSTQIIRTLLDREWARVVGYRDVPGKPALYGTTRQFLDHFNLKNLNELPALAELVELDEVARQLDLEIGADETITGETETSDTEINQTEAGDQAAQALAEGSLSVEAEGLSQDLPQDLSGHLDQNQNRNPDDDLAQQQQEAEAEEGSEQTPQGSPKEETMESIVVKSDEIEQRAKSDSHSFH